MLPYVKLVLVHWLTDQLTMCVPEKERVEYSSAVGWAEVGCPSTKKKKEGSIEASTLFCSYLKGHLHSHSPILKPQHFFAP
jgi:hypothetical protein